MIHSDKSIKEAQGMRDILYKLLSKSIMDENYEAQKAFEKAKKLSTRLIDKMLNDNDRAIKKEAKRIGHIFEKGIL